MMIYANIAVEDLLSEAVVRKITAINGSYWLGTCYMRGGFGYLKTNINGFNNAAKGTPFIVLTDLEDECAPSLISHWLTNDRHPNLIFRVAIKEVEAWLLADSIGIASYFKISQSLVPTNIEMIDDPKKIIIELAKRSPKRKLKLAIVPPNRSTARIGPNYNEQLIDYVNSSWDIKRACGNSDSLNRAVKAITSFKLVC